MNDRELQAMFRSARAAEAAPPFRAMWDRATGADLAGVFRAAREGEPAPAFAPRRRPRPAAGARWSFGALAPATAVLAVVILSFALWQRAPAPPAAPSLALEWSAPSDRLLAMSDALLKPDVPDVSVPAISTLRLQFPTDSLKRRLQ